MALRQKLHSSNSTATIQTQIRQESKQESTLPMIEIPYEDISINAPLSGGGASITFLGEYKHEQVVIKAYTIDPKYPRVATQSMFKEWEVMSASFPSQYVVKPIAYSQKPALVVMEYVQNGALDTVMASRSLTWQQRLLIANDVALGLLRLLEKGFVHRDIKSANIFITKEFRAKIGDFDLSRKVDSKEDIKASGTIEYVAPEYCYADRLKMSLQAADVFSFGVVLFELSVGSEIFFEYRKITDDLVTSGQEVAYGRVTVIKDIIKDHSHDWPGTLKTIILDCLDTDPQKRPSMHDLQERLSSLLGELNKKNEPIQRKFFQSALLFSKVSDKSQAQESLQRTKCCVIM